MSSKKHTRTDLEKAIDAIAKPVAASTAEFIFLVSIYLVTSVTTSFVASARFNINMFGVEIPAFSLAGVLSSLSTICVILLSFYCGKRGRIASIILLTASLPGLFMGIFLRHNYTSIPGLFSSIVTFGIIFLIYNNNKKLTKFREAMTHQALTDSLSGIPNRYAASELISEFIKQKKKFAMVFINLNGFKTINDTMGFDAGNEVLVQVAHKWKQIAGIGITGTSDFVSRTGGDEFCLIISDFKDDDEIVRSIKFYEDALNDNFTIGGIDFHISASFGYSIYPEDGNDKDSIISYSNQAMREVKSSPSSDHILKFTKDLIREDHRIEAEEKIRYALQNDGIYFNLQPQFDMNHKLRGFEALARMKDKDGNFVSPGEFIPIAEKIGLIDQLDGTVYRKATKFFAELIKKTGADLTLSINVSVRHLMKSDFLTEISNLLTSSGLSAENLEIEITESIMIESMDKAMECIGEVRNMGIKIAIDDFGTGYSSLSYLNNIPANLLKIDKSFIDNINTGDSARQYVAAIISIGHILGFEVISEGVEDERQLDTLKDIGCDFIQGFIWGRPLPAEEAEKLTLSQFA